jgi:hypothetical protein
MSISLSSGEKQQRRDCRNPKASTNVLKNSRISVLGESGNRRRQRIPLQALSQNFRNARRLYTHVANEINAALTAIVKSASSLLMGLFERNNSAFF